MNMLMRRILFFSFFLFFRIYPCALTRTGTLRKILDVTRFQNLLERLQGNLRTWWGKKYVVGLARAV